MPELDLQDIAEEIKIILNDNGVSLKTDNKKIYLQRDDEIFELPHATPHNTPLPAAVGATTPDESHQVDLNRKARKRQKTTPSSSTKKASSAKTVSKKQKRLLQRFSEARSQFLQKDIPTRVTSIETERNKYHNTVQQRTETALISVTNMQEVSEPGMSTDYQKIADDVLAELRVIQYCIHIAQVAAIHTNFAMLNLHQLNVVLDNVSSTRIRYADAYD
ncbi:hypothetical protein BDB00DRAFT_878188 [Zychaea mexicana]|uniref:uncharacterized protein n=1 Tax=Zychaea mexicana TaxID=64656 RepID=UPI0022FDBB36|nr:uncharacterized protein BDB00DRAFT_878188 [Zychaea mexicana]KAI9484982.1 hypothetical protein BDB00DRAFT_878188 [Zychaea mexicana]